MLLVNVAHGLLALYLLTLLAVPKVQTPLVALTCLLAIIGGQWLKAPPLGRRLREGWAMAVPLVGYATLFAVQIEMGWLRWRDWDQVLICALGLGVLGGVRQRLGHREVDDCPHRLRDQGQVGLLRLDDDAGRQRGPSRQVLQGRCQSALGQDRRSDAAHRFTQILQGGLRAVLRGIDPLQQRGPGRGGGVVLGQRLSGQAQTAQVHGEGDELLLGAVV